MQLTSIQRIMSFQHIGMFEKSFSEIDRFKFECRVNACLQYNLADSNLNTLLQTDQGLFVNAFEITLLCNLSIQIKDKYFYLLQLKFYSLLLIYC